MRITNSMLTAQGLRDLQANYAAMAKAQEQVSSGKRLNRPSDDPADVQQAIKTNASLASIAQYLRNIGTAQRTTTSAETALSSASDAVQRLRELTVEAQNGTLSSSDRASMAQEVQQLRDQLVSLANTKVGDDYLFSGQKTSTPAFASATAAYAGDDGPINARIAPGVTIAVNVTADVAFAPAIAAANQLATDLAAGNTPTAGSLASFDSGLDALLAARTRIGAVDNRLSDTQTFLQSSQDAATQLLSHLEDADMASAITEAASRQTTYQAAISINAKILQQSLINEL
jgi:flagellar hook-associated protein 3 FlgL